MYNTIVLLVVTPCLCAQVAPPDKVKATTQSYIVADLLKKETQLNWGTSGKSGRTPLEEIVFLVQTTTGPKNWRGDKAVASLEVVRGETLEITAPAKMHEEIKELLDAVRRLAGIGVRLVSELYEVDRDFFVKQVEPELDYGKRPKAQQIGVPFKELGEKNLRKLKTLRNATTTLPNGGQGCYFSVQKSVLYVAHPTWAGQDEVHETALYGLALHTKVVVSADRRFIELKLEQRQRDLIEIHQETKTHPVTGDEETIEKPEIAETRRLASLTVGDGDWLATILPAAKKDRVRLLLVQPTIVIPDEELEKKLNP